MQERSTNRASSIQDVVAISARQLAEMLSVSLRQIWRLNSAGKVPKPIRLGGSVRWDRDEILRWFKDGCPDRGTWEARNEVAK